MCHSKIIRHQTGHENQTESNRRKTKVAAGDRERNPDMKGDVSALTRGKYIKDRKKSNLLKKHKIKEDKNIPTKIEQLKQQV